MLDPNLKSKFQNVNFFLPWGKESEKEKFQNVNFFSPWKREKFQNVNFSLGKSLHFGTFFFRRKRFPPKASRNKNEIMKFLGFSKIWREILKIYFLFKFFFLERNIFQGFHLQILEKIPKCKISFFIPCVWTE